MLKFMYICKDPVVAKIAQDAGADRIFVDMEYIGKAQRQGGMDTVQNSHSIADVKAVRNVVKPGSLLVRCNKIYEGSQQEIEDIIAAGADCIMLPYFKTLQEVKTFLNCVNKRTKTMLLVETKEAFELLDSIIVLKEVDELYLGLNDLSLSLGLDFMFKPLALGYVDAFAQKCQAAHMPFGFGGLAQLDKGLVPGEQILQEHYRLGSTRVILSRSFCDTDLLDNYEQIEELFISGIKNIRACEAECQKHLDSNDLVFFESNHQAIKQSILGEKQ